jgi:hypothetical protein
MPRVSRATRGFSFLAATLAVVIATPLLVPAQQSSGQPESKTKDVPKDGAAPAGKAAEAEEEGVVDARKSATSDLEARYLDVRTRQAIDNNFPELFKASISAAQLKQLPALEKQFAAMAAGQAAVNLDVIRQVVRAETAQLTNHENIKAMLDEDPPANASDEDVKRWALARAAKVKVIEDATETVVQALNTANARNNSGFRSALTKEMVAVAPEVLKNHLFARNQFMVALSRSHDEQAIPVFVEQLDDPDQVLAVKLNGAIGLIELADDGRSEVSGTAAVHAAKALADFLGREKSTFWPVQERAVRALGALRQSTSTPNPPTADLSEAVLELLADPTVSPFVRSRAAWALGLMRPLHPRYNFALIAAHAGTAAADIADHLVAVQPTNPDLAIKLAALLLQIEEGLRGDPHSGIRDEGLLNASHPNLSSQQTAVAEVERNVRAVAKAAADLLSEVSGRLPKARAALSQRARALRDSVAKNKPSDLALIPGGEQFRIPEPKPQRPPAEQAKTDGRTKKTSDAKKKSAFAGPS